MTPERFATHNSMGTPPPNRRQAATLMREWWINSTRLIPQLLATGRGTGTFPSPLAWKKITETTRLMATGRTTTVGATPAIAPIDPVAGIIFLAPPTNRQRPPQ